MKVTLLTWRTGGGQPGDVLDLSVEEARKLIERGSAEPVRARKTERAVKAARAERAAK